MSSGAVEESDSKSLEGCVNVRLFFSLVKTIMITIEQKMKVSMLLVSYFPSSAEVLTVRGEKPWFLPIIA